MTILGSISRWFSASDIGRVFQFVGIARQVGVMLIAVLLAKSMLSLEDIGIYEQLMFLGYLVTFFWMDGLVKGFVSMYPRVPMEEQSSFAVQVTTILLLCGGLLAVLSWFGGQWLINQFAGGTVPFGYWQSFIGFIFLYQISMLVEHLYLLRNDTRGLWTWMIFSFIGIVSFLIVPIWIYGELSYGLWGLTFFGVLRLVWLLRIHWPIQRFAWKAALLSAWWKLSAPLIAYAIVAGAVLIIDGWIINVWFKDPGVFAIYRYGAREIPFSMVLAGATTTFLITRLATSWQEGLEEVKKRTTSLMHLFFPITIIVMGISKVAFPWIFNDELAGAADIFRIYLFILVSRFVLSSSLFVSRGQTGFLFRVGVLELIVNAVLSLWFVQYWGIVGVAWATVIAYTFEKVVHILWIYRRWHIQPGNYIPVRILLIYSIILALVYIIT